MESHIIGLIISLGVLLLCSAFFSASETAFSSLNRIKLKNLASRGNKRADSTLKLADNYDKLLSTVLIGNNIVNIASSALATLLFVGFLGNAGVSVATLVMTVLVLMIGEISPKTLAKEAPEQFAMFATPVLRGFIFLLSPVNRLVSRWKGFIIRAFRISGNRSVTEEELLTFVEEVRQEGGINKGEEDMIRRTIEFDDMTANDIFTPRIDVAAISLSATPEEIEKVFRDTGYSRLPVYRDSIDQIVGIILLKDFYSEVVRGGHIPESIIKPAVFVSKSMKIAGLLKTLQEKKSHMAILVDEFGGTVGIITLEDIVEELVGEIWDEHDEVVNHIVKLDPQTYRVLGNTSLEDFFDYFFPAGGKEKNKAPYPRNTTVGSWVVEQLGSPRAADFFQYKHLSITVTKILRHRVMEVTVSAAGEANSDAPEEEMIDHGTK
ncbi:MAG: hemolysin family protein [Treponema sp.]|jgi:CBS domain containing-hemolysin-like protein|nr:hemolysin family protein [Treponema sp.]